VLTVDIEVLHDAAAALPGPELQFLFRDRGRAFFPGAGIFFVGFIAL
jgi:hypothetical protein